MPAGDKQPLSLLQDDAAWEREPARLATELGHYVIRDGNQRWTCTRCGYAVLRRGVNIYGRAATLRCGEEEAP